MACSSALVLAAEAGQGGQEDPLCNVCKEPVDMNANDASKNNTSWVHKRCRNVKVHYKDVTQGLGPKELDSLQEAEARDPVGFAKKLVAAAPADGSRCFSQCIHRW